jgi:hypothetical protein
MMDTPHGRDPHEGDRITPLFGLVFAAALAITILNGLAMVLMSWSGKDGEDIKSAVATCADIFKMGVAAVLGLTGGKTTTSR